MHFSPEGKKKCPKLLCLSGSEWAVPLGMIEKIIILFHITQEQLRGQDIYSYSRSSNPGGFYELWPNEKTGAEV